jgi:Tfp pilus assembly pilus retraction ATPase PilT
MAMFGSLEHLPALDPSEWSRVRDLSIPLTRRDSGGYMVNEIALEGAVAFLGGARARRLFGPNCDELLHKLLPVFSQTEVALGEEHRRFRLIHEDMRFRAQIGRNAAGEDLQLRVLPDQTPLLEDLDMPAAWRSLLLSNALMEGGLILVTAPQGQGKTTTASSLVASRLKAFGGFANTCEDPIELPMQGLWDAGLCVQRPVGEGPEADGPGTSYYGALIEALRQFPVMSGGGTILFVGEIRDSLTAVETLKAAANGHLVVATLHGRSAATAIQRMVTLCSAGATGLSYDQALQLLSDALRGVFSQRLGWHADRDGWRSATISGDVIWSSDHTSQLAKLINFGKIADIHGLVDSSAGVLKSASARDLVAPEQLARLLSRPG